MEENNLEKDVRKEKPRFGIIVDKSRATGYAFPPPPPYSKDSLVYKSNWDKYMEKMKKQKELVSSKKGFFEKIIDYIFG